MFVMFLDEYKKNSYKVQFITEHFEHFNEEPKIKRWYIYHMSKDILCVWIILFSKLGSRISSTLSASSHKNSKVNRQA